MTQILNNNSNIGAEILYEVMFGKGKCFFPGGFKPPHIGHYEALKDLVSRSYITEVEVIISSKPREGITAEESKAVWDIFLKAQPLQKVKVVISPDPSPVITIYHYLEAYPQESPVYLAGAKDEVDDQGYFESLQKRFGDRVLTIAIDEKVGRISGAYVREVIRSGDFEHFKECIPPAAVNKGFADDIFTIVSKTSSQEKQTVKEQVIKELGDSSPLSYTKVDSKWGKTLHSIPTDVKYRFETSKGTGYEVGIWGEGEFDHTANAFTKYQVEFGVLKNGYPSGPDTMTNKHEIGQVMSTISTIIKDYITEYNPPLIRWSGHPKTKQEWDNLSPSTSTARSRLYQYYLEKNLHNISNYIFTHEHGYSVLKRKQELNEQVSIQIQAKPLSSEMYLPDFFGYVCNMLEIQRPPELILLDEPLMDETDGQPSFACYEPATGIIKLYKEKRHIVDCMRSLAHEMCHHRQNELNQLVSSTDGNTGSEIENEANSVAGMLVRKYGKDNPQIYF